MTKVITIYSYWHEEGKTMSALFLSLYLQKRGKTLCVDLDRSRKLTNLISALYSFNPNLTIKQPFVVQSQSISELNQLFTHNTYDYIIVDTHASRHTHNDDGQITKFAIRYSDIVIDVSLLNTMGTMGLGLSLYTIKSYNPIAPVFVLGNKYACQQNAEPVLSQQLIAEPSVTLFEPYIDKMNKEDDVLNSTVLKNFQKLKKQYFQAFNQLYI